MRCHRTDPRCSASTSSGSRRCWPRVAAFAVLLAIYAATTVRDPMAKRVKALNDRREQLKAGITASTSKRRAKLVQQERDDRPDPRRSCRALKVLQDSQLKAAQTKLMQAGIRSKEWAVAVIFGRLVLPIVLGGPMLYLVYGTDMFADWSPLKRYGLVAGTLHPGLQGARHLPEEQDHQAHRRDPQGPARRARPAGDLRRGGPDRRRRVPPRRRRNWAGPIPNSATNSR